jgi:environmental stress-induced protein Ves
MNHRILKKEDFTRSKWSGGITTEMVIAPEGSSYDKRNFEYRISTAQVNNIHSEFSKLPGISRKLMVLDGTVILHHEGHYSKTLNKFDTDSFEGGWTTSSDGKCVDFNLMFQGSINGELKAHKVSRDKLCEYPITSSVKTLYIYVFSGKAGVGFDPIFLNLKAGELLEISEPDTKHLLIEGQIDSELIIVELYATF